MSEYSFAKAPEKPIGLDPLSYNTITNTIEAFRRNVGKEGWEQNKMDEPGTYYFKILFYFNNDGGAGKVNGSGLLGWDWTSEGGVKNSAYNFLKLNAEDERAQMIKEFNILLSDINTYSPWYWQELSGLADALKHDISKGFKVDEERKKITIKCMPDAYDTRIATLLDLYRSACFSWKTKREIVPANLRKFDMGIYIFQTPMKRYVKGDTKKGYGEYVANVGGGEKYRTNSKYVEFHNCEFDITSFPSAYDGLNNSEGKPLEFSVDINFDDAYEERYNELLNEFIGDFVEYEVTPHKTQTQPDIYGSQGKLQDVDTRTSAGEYDETLVTKTNAIRENTDYPYSRGRKKGILSGLIGQGTEYLKGIATSAIKKLWMGNMYGFSASDLVDTAGTLLSGNVLGAVNDVLQDAGKDASKFSSSGIAHFITSKPQEGLNKLKNGALGKFPGWQQV